MRLADYATGRDNNFNLVRFLAAFAVLWSHSYALTLSPAHEPWVKWIGYTPGGAAVDVFFVTSGFLVTASLLRLDDFRKFFRARALRIFPALIVMSLLLTFVLGPFFTTVSLHEYFTATGTWKFLVKDAIPLFGVKRALPGVFEGHVFDDVNGSLWTLPKELYCYISLAMTWWVAGFAKSDKLRMFTRLVVVVAATMLLLFWPVHAAGHPSWHNFRLWWCFFCGAGYWLFRARIPMHGAVFAVIASLLAVAIAVPSLFFWVYPLAMPYLVLWLAYVPGGWVRGFNRLGDYSYGVYIYAYPMQQSAIALVPGITPMQTLCISAAGTLALAIASWHLVEKPMLARKTPGSAH